jgi:hypothetical protein
VNKLTVSIVPVLVLHISGIIFNYDELVSNLPRGSLEMCLPAERINAPKGIRSDYRI